MIHRRLVLSSVLLALHSCCFVLSGSADETGAGGRAPWTPVEPDAWVGQLMKQKIAGVRISAIGATKRGTPIPALLGEDDLDLTTKKTRILLVPLGVNAPVDDMTDAVRWFYTSEDAAPWRKRYSISAIPSLRPNLVNLTPLVFPPKGPAYTNGGDPEAAYLWRWIGMHAPDLIVEFSPSYKLDEFILGVPGLDQEAMNALREHKSSVHSITDKGHLNAEVTIAAPSGTGTIPMVAGLYTEKKPRLPPLLTALDDVQFKSVSPARKELQSRLDRTPLQVAQQLAKVYGQDLRSVTYIPALAAIAQARLAKLTEDEQRLATVHKLAVPYVEGKKSARTNSHVAWAGHLVFAELADASEGRERERYVALAKAAADEVLKDDGTADLKQLSSTQMSDLVFMGGPILARVGRLTGDEKYLAAAAAHVQNMAKFTMRDDGLYRHSPLSEAAWGRGNGFPALGLTMILSDLPKDHQQRDELLQLYRKHMNALAEHQDYTGAWHQVIDHEESYRELSCTCMITFAMARGVQRGWLDAAKFKPVIESAWYAIRTRVSEDGSLVDVCTGTGKQKSLRAYFDRTAILGRDARGGAMALLVAVELAAWRTSLP